jgi:hypothetical protein
MILPHGGNFSETSGQDIPLVFSGHHDQNSRYSRPMKTYDSWLGKLRKRAQPSGALSQWAEMLAKKQGGDAEMWREHLREILEQEEQASLDLILDLDLITAPAKESESPDKQIPLW